MQPITRMGIIGEYGDLKLSCNGYHGDYWLFIGMDFVNRVIISVTNICDDPYSSRLLNRYLPTLNELNSHNEIDILLYNREVIKC